MILEPIPKGLRKTYAQKFSDRNLHHLIPRSRGGDSTQFNLYPYNKSAHSAYHDIFSNMRIDEIWDGLSDTHHTVFESGCEYIRTPWLKVCLIEVGTEKEKKRFEERRIERLQKVVSAELIQERWLRAFGSDSINTARKKLKEMMLYMVFGMNVLKTDILYNSDNLQKFLERSPCDAERCWAFRVCFGSRGCSVQAMKSKIAKILR